ncbi:transposase domain-containing protein [Comamonas kerstersii]|uniref:transposase domain-containing protein n=1 Tax=Comamonas kerstersii TaxID=225992 RepID=UPI001B340E1B|nr:transposase domain-containing protein [Comamonas kerstersii]
MGVLSGALRQCLSQAPDQLDQLAAFIDRSWIEQALQRTGKASIRRRKLPAEHAVWLVIGLALFRNLPLWQVVDQLALCLHDRPLPAPSASVQARQRLGVEPLQELFHLLANAWTRHQPQPRAGQGRAAHFGSRWLRLERT